MLSSNTTTLKGRRSVPTTLSTMEDCHLIADMHLIWWLTIIFPMKMDRFQTDPQCWTAPETCSNFLCHSDSAEVKFEFLRFAAFPNITSSILHVQDQMWIQNDAWQVSGHFFMTFESGCGSKPRDPRGTTVGTWRLRNRFYTLQTFYRLTTMPGTWKKADCGVDSTCCRWLFQNLSTKDLWGVKQCICSNPSGNHCTNPPCKAYVARRQNSNQINGKMTKWMEAIWTC